MIEILHKHNENSKTITYKSVEMGKLGININVVSLLLKKSSHIHKQII